MNQEQRQPRQCARCGSCTAVCPVYRADGRETLTARGRMHLLELDLAAGPSPQLQEIFSACLLCGACEEACPRDLPIRERVITARSGYGAVYGSHGLQKFLARKALARPEVISALARAGISLKQALRLPMDSGLRRKLGLLEAPVAPAAPSPLPASRKEIRTVQYFPGCLAKHLQPSICRATAALTRRLDGSSLQGPAAEACCGLAAHAAGDLKLARQLACRNIEAYRATNGPILTSCASCFAHLRSYPALFLEDDAWRERARAFADRVVEFCAFFLERAVQPLIFTRPTRIFYHDPCHLRFTEQGSILPRRLLARIANLRLLEPVDGPRCCGQGGLFHLGYPGLSADIFKRCLTNLVEEPELVTTTCSGCLMQWQEQLHDRPDISVAHLAQVLLESMPDDEFGGLP